MIKFVDTLEDLEGFEGMVFTTNSELLPAYKEHKIYKLYNLSLPEITEEEDTYRYFKYCELLLDLTNNKEKLFKFLNNDYMDCVFIEPNIYKVVAICNWFNIVPTYYSCNENQYIL